MLCTVNIVNISNEYIKLPGKPRVSSMSFVFVMLNRWGVHGECGEKKLKSVKVQGRKRPYICYGEMGSKSLNYEITATCFF
jgi:hypothetical protein